MEKTQITTFHFPMPVFSDVERWIRPVVEGMSQDKTLCEFLEDETFLSKLAFVANIGYHLNFVEDSVPSVYLGLDKFNTYPIHVRKKLVSHLRNCQDTCGYIRASLDFPN